MKRRIVVLAVLCILIAVESGQRSATAVQAQGDPTQDILRLVNELRMRNGLPAFVWDIRLATAAQNQANYMAANNIYSHTGAGGSSPQSRAQAAGFPGRATENIVGGTNLTPGQGVIWWQNSPIHLNTLLAPHYSHVGIGKAQGFDQNFYALVAGSPSDVIAGRGPEVTQGGDQLLAPVAPIEIAAPREDGSVVHVVGPGQSFWIIAARYEIPLEELYYLNNLTESSVINPGDEVLIRLGEGQEPPPTPTPPTSVVVREGDSWWTIAAWHKLSVADILWLNSATEDTVLQAGDEVRIRLGAGESPPPTATPQLTHVVSAGETAWDISQRYALPLDELLTLNGLGQAAVLSIGQELVIVTPTPVPTETTTPLPTITPSPTSTSLPSPAPTRTALAVSQLAVTQPADMGSAGESTQGGFGRTGLILGVGMLILGAVAVVLVFRRIP